MKMFTTRQGQVIGVALTLLAAGITGCASHNQEAQKQTSTDATGAAFAHSGIMSQDDYTRIKDLAHSVTQSHTISDSDLDWTLSLLKSGGNSLARARAFTTLSEIRPMSPAQKTKIEPAITPYLSSTDKLDYAGAHLVEKASQASN